MTKKDLARKFEKEIFASELMLLSYYIAMVNIEQSYIARAAELGVDPGETVFKHGALFDVFGPDNDGKVTHRRMTRYRETLKAKSKIKDEEITAIITNPHRIPPAQKNENDDNKNTKCTGTELTDEIKRQLREKI